MALGATACVRHHPAPCLLEDDFGHKGRLTAIKDGSLSEPLAGAGIEPRDQDYCLETQSESAWVLSYFSAEDSQQREEARIADALDSADWQERESNPAVDRDRSARTFVRGADVVVLSTSMGSKIRWLSSIESPVFEATFELGLAANHEKAPSPSRQGGQ